MYNSASDGNLRNTAGSQQSAINDAAKTMMRTASTGTLGGKTFGAGEKEGGGQMEFALVREMEKLIKKQVQLEKTLKTRDRIAKDKMQKQLNAELFKIDKDTGSFKRDDFGRPIKKTTEGAMVKKKGSAEAALLGNLEETLQRLDGEIVLDEKGVRDIDKHMFQIEKEREHLRMLNASSTEFIESMASEEQLGSVLKKYGAMEKTLQREYHEIRHKHQQGIKMLQDEFDYHPAYRRGFMRKWTTEDGQQRENLAYKRNPEEFTGRYFTPLRDPMKKR